MKFHITLIRPPIVISKSEIGLYAVPPLGVAYLAGYLISRGFDCAVIDCVGEAMHQVNEIGNRHFVTYGLSNSEVVERIPRSTNMIGVSCSFTKGWVNDRELIALIKKKFPNPPMVCGGEHITAEPILSMQLCPAIDFSVLGEGEATLTELVMEWMKTPAQRKLQDVQGIVYRKDGEYPATPRRQRILQIDEIPRPRWDLIPIRTYLDWQKSFGVNRGRSMPILATRGCPYQCTFCSNPTMWGNRWISRCPASLIEEMAEYIDKYQATNFDFYDLTTLIDRKWIIELTDLLLNKKWEVTWQLPSGTRAEIIDEEVCRRLYASGCRNISYSPESASPRVLKIIDKRIKLKQVTRSMRSAVRAGLNVKVNLVFGFPDEKHSDVWRNLWYILRLAWIGVHDLAVWSFAPYPGSKLFEQLKMSEKINSFDDKYLLSIIYSSFFQAVSWNERMGSRWINAYRLFGQFSFYILVYLMHPLRIFRLFRNIMTGRHESRLETVLADILIRRFRMNRKKC